MYCISHYNTNLCAFAHSGGSRESLESLEYGRFRNDPFSKDPFLRPRVIFIQGHMFNTPPPSENTLLGVGGVYKRGEGVLHSCRWGGFKLNTPLPRLKHA